MQNTLSDFPPTRFHITAYCECGHSALVGIVSLPSTLPVDTLRNRLRCSSCGSREIDIRIGWSVACAFAYGDGSAGLSSGVG